MDWLHQRLAGRAVGLAICVAIAVAMGLLLRAARRGRPIDDPWGGPLLFRHSGLFRGFGFFMGFVAPLAIPILWVLMPRKEGDEIPALVLLAMFFALGLPLWWEGTRFALLASPQGLECRSPWRGVQSFPWDEVERVSYNPQYMWFLIEATGGRTFRVPVFVAGISQFLEQCEQHLPPAALAGAEVGYHQVGRPFRPRGV